MFYQKLQNIIKKNNSLICIGLDSEIAKLPEEFKNLPNAQFEFNKKIIDSTHDLVCAYKPNTAFYEAIGTEGIQSLKLTCDYLHEKYPEIINIIDAKRADIGNTNEGCAKFVFDYLSADAITLHHYLGKEALEPFLKHADKGCIILCRTSNPGSGELQDIEINEKKLYEIVAEKIAKEWNTNQNCMLVIGATYPAEIAKVRKIVGDMPLLIPGIGAQGGNLEETIKAGLNSKKSGIIISSSRGIIFASSSNNFAAVARSETIKLQEATNKYR